MAVSYWRRDRQFYSAWSSEPRKYLAVCRTDEIPSFSVILRPLVMARPRPRESNPRPTALQLSAPPTKPAGNTYALLTKLV